MVAELLFRFVVLFDAAIEHCPINDIRVLGTQGRSLVRVELRAKSIDSCFLPELKPQKYCNLFGVGGEGSAPLELHLQGRRLQSRSVIHSIIQSLDGSTRVPALDRRTNKSNFFKLNFPYFDFP